MQLIFPRTPILPHDVSQVADSPVGSADAFPVRRPRRGRPGDGAAGGGERRATIRFARAGDRDGHQRLGRAEAIDAWVERLAPQWPPRRQPGVDRSILRLAVWELTSTDTPPKVVIDEAIELAKTFSTENSPAFVNGVLDAVLKEQLETLTEAEARSTKSE